MGKPFKSELIKLKDTYEWVMNLNLDSLSKTISNIDSPIYFVGSGGSLSACYFGVILAEQQGLFAKALTPLDLYSVRNTIRKTVIIFISAGGKNSDILFGFKTAINFEAKTILSICMQSDSKLGELSNKYSISKIYEFSLPVGKDGFLATNSLIAYFVILNRIFSALQDKLSFSNSESLKEIISFTNTLKIDSNITVLYNGFSKPIAYDIESKSTEAALYPILLSDYRNFGHGRHHWFAKKENTAAIIGLATPEDEFLAKKTIDAIPNHIPKLLLKTEKNNSFGSLDLLVKSFYLIDKFGESLNIDPGKPGVPAFGRKLYNLKYATAFTKSENDFELSLKARTAISRKIKKPFTFLDKKEIQVWKQAYDNFIKKLNKASFGAIVFDYDGTICSAIRKSDGPDEAMTDKLKFILENGFYIGVVTGRGKSVRIDLQKILPKKYWSQVVIGYYNGSDIGLLEENSLPNLNLKKDISLEILYELLTKKTELEITSTLRPNQLTIEFNNSKNISDKKETLIRIIKSSGQKNIDILESSHSMDIIPIGVSKIDVLRPLKKILTKKKLPADVLCIGDRGMWPGNDFKLLDTPYGLSVYEVNNKKSSCWNIAPNGITHTDATLQYLNWLQFEHSGMKIKIGK
jgi:hydroxymethylpyrimidine pyrophosphatase-like HAD family hydrolase|tara:strand:+ start:30248 stop:32149 length:1902 start_codon:yes stop_codon:yes gene_type:complete